MSAVSSQAQLDDAATPFPSFVALRTAYADLLRRHDDSGDTPEILSEIDHFIRRARASGALLDADTDRRATQVLLDYWTATLYRLGHEPPSGSLAAFDPTLSPQLDDTLRPYLGLNAFRESDSKRFFGRDQLIEQWLQRLATERLLIVLGPSGSGKSSLVQGGLVPKLKSGALPGSGDWRYYRPLVPGATPLASLAHLYRPPDADPDEWLREQVPELEHDPGHLSRVLGGDIPALLVVDQFEEVFTLCHDDGARQAFTANLLGLSEAPEARHTVIVTMRSDFEDRIPKLPELAMRFERARVHATPLNAAELRATIQGPADDVGLKFEEGVVDQLIGEILGEPAGLPLLQFALLKLWETRDHNRVTWQAYQRLGGARNALARSADAFYANLIEEDRQTVKRILLQMVRLGQDLEPTSRRILRRQLYASGEARDRIDRAIEALEAEHLVRLTPGDTPDDEQIEVAHESLVRNWPELGSWLEEERWNIRKRQRLTDAAQQWQEDRARAPLWSRSLVNEFERYVNLTDVESAFLEASRQAADAADREREETRERELEQARALATEQELRAQAEHQRAEAQVRSNRIFRVALAVTLVLVILLVALSAYALNQSQDATQQRNVASQQRNRALSEVIAANALKVLPADPELSVLLAREAYRTADTPQADAALSESLAAFPGRGALQIRDETGAINGVAFSPDRTQVATASEDGSVRIWDLQSHRPLRTVPTRDGGKGHPAALGIAWAGATLAIALDDGSVQLWNVKTHTSRVLSIGNQPVNDVAFSPDGGRMVAADGDGTAYLWSINVATGGVTPLATIRTGSGEARRAVFSPDGKKVLIVAADGTASVWAMSSPGSSPRPVFTLSDKRSEVRTVTGAAFSPPDGSLIATADSGGAVRIFAGSSGQQDRSITVSNARLNTVAFSPDGKLLIVAGSDRTAQVLQTSTGTEVETLSGDTAPVNTARFSADGSVIITGAAGGKARIWAVQIGSVVSALGPQGDQRTPIVYKAIFSPDDKWVVTGSQDGLGRIYDAKTGEQLAVLRGHRGPIYNVAISNDGRWIATASASGTARVWTSDGKHSIILRHRGAVYNVSFNKDGTRLVTASADGTAGLWDVATGTKLHSFRTDGSVTRADFDPNGDKIVTVSQVSRPGQVSGRIWDARTYQRITALRSPQSLVSPSFSPDGRYVVAGSPDGSAGIWDARTGRKIHSLLGHTQGVYTTAYSPDGRWIATGSPDTTARVWDAHTGRLVQVLVGHSDWVYAVSFSPVSNPSPGNDLVLTASEDGTARVWRVAGGTLVAVLAQQHGFVWSASFSHDGKAVVTSSEDNYARIYQFARCDVCVTPGQLDHLASQRVARDLTPAEKTEYLH